MLKQMLPSRVCNTNNSAFLKIRVSKTAATIDHKTNRYEVVVVRIDEVQDRVYTKEAIFGLEEVFGEKHLEFLHSR